MVIRSAGKGDAAAVAALTQQLGYHASDADVAERLARILARTDAVFLVAESDGDVIGWVHAARVEYVDAGPFVTVAGMVVDRRHRRGGVGRALLGRVEDWARQQGAGVVRLSSSVARTEAHRFYESVGYRNVKTQYTFLKPLDGNTESAVRAFVPRIDPPA